MKVQRIVLIGILVFFSASMLAAQNTLPDASDSNCWSSFTALRACQMRIASEQQYYAEHCTSYPEYQCNNYYEPPQKKVAKKTSSKADHAVSSTAVQPVLASDTTVQSSSAN